MSVLQPCIFHIGHLYRELFMTKQELADRLKEARANIEKCLVDLGFWRGVENMLLTIKPEIERTPTVSSEPATELKANEVK